MGVYINCQKSFLSSFSSDTHFITSCSLSLSLYISASMKTCGRKALRPSRSFFLKYHSPFFERKQSKYRYANNVIVLILEKAILMASDGCSYFHPDIDRHLYEEKIRDLDGGVLAGCCGRLHSFPVDNNYSAYSACKYFTRKIRENLISPTIRKLKNDVNLVDLRASFHSRPRSKDFEIIMGRWNANKPEVVLVNEDRAIDDFECIGSGAKLAHPILNRRYVRNMSVREGSDLLVKAIVKASREDPCMGGWVRVWCLRQDGSLHHNYY